MTVLSLSRLPFTTWQLRPSRGGVAAAFELVQVCFWRKPVAARVTNLDRVRPSFRAAWIMKHEEFVPLLAQQHALRKTLLMVGQRMAPESTMH